MWVFSYFSLFFYMNLDSYSWYMYPSYLTIELYFSRLLICFLLQGIGWLSMSYASVFELYFLFLFFRVHSHKDSVRCLFLLYSRSLWHMHWRDLRIAIIEFSIFLLFLYVDLVICSCLLHCEDLIGATCWFYFHAFIFYSDLLCYPCHHDLVYAFDTFIMGICKY